MVARAGRHPLTETGPRIRAGRALRCACALTAVLAGCAAPSETKVTVLPPDAAAPDPCEPGQTDDGESGCVPAGVPPRGCAAGFVADDRGGCEPVLPAEPCAPGEIALPGEESCRPIMSCGTGPWGELPIDGATQHVDGAYGAADSDGTPQRPWRTISEAVLAAESGALVAVAAGTYAEAVLVQSKPVRVWGRCPELVQVVAPAGEAAATIGLAGAAGSELGGMALTGDDAGVTVDSATSFGVMLYGATAALDRVAIRNTQLTPDGDMGFGLDVSAEGEIRSTATVRGCLLEGNHSMGMVAMGADVTVERTAIRDQQPTAPCCATCSSCTAATTRG